MCIVQGMQAAGKIDKQLYEVYTGVYILNLLQISNGNLWYIVKHINAHIPVFLKRGIACSASSSNIIDALDFSATTSFAFFKRVASVNRPMRRLPLLFVVPLEGIMFDALLSIMRL